MPAKAAIPPTATAAAPPTIAIPIKPSGKKPQKQVESIYQIQISYKKCYLNKKQKQKKRKKEMA